VTNKRPIAFIVVETFLWTTLSFDLALASEPRGSDFLRPKKSSDTTAQQLQTELTGELFSAPSDVNPAEPASAPAAVTAQLVAPVTAPATPNLIPLEEPEKIDELPVIELEKAADGGKRRRFFEEIPPGIETHIRDLLTKDLGMDRIPQEAINIFLSALRVREINLHGLSWEINHWALRLDEAGKDEIRRDPDQITEFAKEAVQRTAIDRLQAGIIPQVEQSLYNLMRKGRITSIQAYWASALNRYPGVGGRDLRLKLGGGQERKVRSRENYQALFEAKELYSDYRLSAEEKTQRTEELFGELFDKIWSRLKGFREGPVDVRMPLLLLGALYPELQSPLHRAIYAITKRHTTFLYRDAPAEEMKPVEEILQEVKANVPGLTLSPQEESLLRIALQKTTSLHDFQYEFHSYAGEFRQINLDPALLQAAVSSDPALWTEWVSNITKSLIQAVPGLASHSKVKNFETALQIFLQKPDDESAEEELRRYGLRSDTLAVLATYRTLGEFRNARQGTQRRQLSKTLQEFPKKIQFLREVRVENRRLRQSLMVGLRDEMIWWIENARDTLGADEDILRAIKESRLRGAAVLLVRR